MPGPVISFAGWMAQQESTRKSERVKAALAAKKEAGEKAGGGLGRVGGQRGSRGTAQGSSRSSPAVIAQGMVPVNGRGHSYVHTQFCTRRNPARISHVRRPEGGHDEKAHSRCCSHSAHGCIGMAGGLVRR